VFIDNREFCHAGLAASGFSAVKAFDATLMGKSSIRRDTAMAVDALRHFSKAFVRENFCDGLPFGVLEILIFRLELADGNLHLLRKERQGNW